MLKHFQDISLSISSLTWLTFTVTTFLSNDRITHTNASLKFKTWNGFFQRSIFVRLIFIPLIDCISIFGLGGFYIVSTIGAYKNNHKNVF